LFLLAVDALGRLIRHAIDVSILERLNPTKAIPVVSRYADDVVMFFQPTRADTAVVRSIMHLFGRASGLLVNYDKSSAITLNCEPKDSALITAELGCHLAELPLTYLGILLMLHRLTRAQMQPLVNKAADKLPTCKSRLMDRSGRLVLVKSMLAAIPLHQIDCATTTQMHPQASREDLEGFFCGTAAPKPMVATAM
jgi:hypothetical protein